MIWKMKILHSLQHASLCATISRPFAWSITILSGRFIPSLLLGMISLMNSRPEVNANIRPLLLSTTNIDPLESTARQIVMQKRSEVDPLDPPKDFRMSPLISSKHTRCSDSPTPWLIRKSPLVCFMACRDWRNPACAGNVIWRTTNYAVYSVTQLPATTSLQS